MSTQIDVDPKLESLAERGEKFYRDNLKDSLEPDQIGRFVAIEPDSGRYFLGSTGTEALVDAKTQMPSSLFFLIRIGYNAADSISGYGSRIR